jgi:hypothetical protein
MRRTGFILITEMRRTGFILITEIRQGILFYSSFPLLCGSQLVSVRYTVKRG